jgi:hypothetical protein
VRGYAIGDRISQPQYGTGTIRLLDEYHTVIDFDEHGIRRFSTPMVKLERSDTVEPGKPAKRTRKPAAPKVPKAAKAAKVAEKTTVAG